MGLLSRRLAKFVEDQPRAPKGSPNGGQWVDQNLTAPGPDDEVRSTGRSIVERDSKLSRELTEEEIDALWAYQGGSFFAINHAARVDGGEEPTVDFNEETNALAAKRMETLRHLANDIDPLTEPVTLYRGNGFAGKVFGMSTSDGIMSVPPADYTAAVAEKWAALEGKVIRENSLLSTTVDPSQAVTWSYQKNYSSEYPRAIYSITAPKGTKGIFMPTIQGEAHDFAEEQEYLLPPGSHVRVKKVTPPTDDDKAFYIELELVSQVGLEDVTKFVDDQPRAPRGTPTGGQWVDRNVGGGSVRPAVGAGVIKRDAKLSRPLTQAEKTALHMYQLDAGGGYSRVSRELASGKEVTVEPWMQRAREIMVAHVQSLQQIGNDMEPLKATATVYRGSGHAGKVFNIGHGAGVDVAEYTAKVAEAWKSRIGKVIREDGFLSTSVDKKFAQRWAAKSNKGKNTPGISPVDAEVGSKFPKVMYSITLPKGTRGIHMPSLIPSARYDKEQEFLMPSGSRLRVKSVKEPTAKDNTFHVELELVSQEAIQKMYTITAPEGIFEPRVEKSDDQPRAPRGSPIGGQWVDRSSSDPVAAEKADVAMASEDFKNGDAAAREWLSKYAGITLVGSMGAGGHVHSEDVRYNDDPDPTDDQRETAFAIYEYPFNYNTNSALRQMGLGIAPETSDWVTGGYYRSSTQEKVTPAEATTWRDQVLRGFHPLDRDIFVYRGITSRFDAMKIPTLPGHHPGESGTVVQDHGFVSTSYRSVLAADHIRFNGGAMVRIKIPKGTPVMFTAIDIQREVVLAPGTKFKVSSERRLFHSALHADSTNMMYSAEVVP